MSNYAVIDVGSNSIRLVVYAVPNDNQESYARSDFSTVANDKVMAGLAAYVVDGVFTQAGIKKATSTIKSHLKHASYFDCKSVSVFATAVLRNAKNSSEAIAAIERGAGCTIDLISGEDEAQLGFMGASSDMSIIDGVAVDVGGGSTELTLVKGGKIKLCHSIPQGSLSTFTSCVGNILPTGAEIECICKHFGEKLTSEIDVAQYQSATLYGIGGSVRAASKMLAMRNDDRVRPKEITASDIESILDKCVARPTVYAREALIAAPERIHTLTPGCAILYETMHQLNASSMQVCKCGIREGYLITRVLNAKVTQPAG